MIDTESLLGKILDRALHGELTQQLPEDGTGELLYQEILKNRQDLVKSGKIKNFKKLPEVTVEEQLFEIPDSWKWVRLGNIASVYGGKRIPAGRKLTTENTGHKYIRVSEMKNGSVLVDDMLYVPEDIYPSISQYIINKEDIYITVAGTIGRIGKIPAEIDGANLTENADRLVFDTVDQDWLIACLSSSEVQREISMSTTQVAQPKLAIKRIEDLIIPLPPLAEQKRMVKILENITPILETIDDLQTQYSSDIEVLKSKLIDVGIQGKLTEQLPEDGDVNELCQRLIKEKKEILKERKGKEDKNIKPVDENTPFDIPSHWKWVRFGDTGLFKKGPFGSALTKSMFVPKGDNTVKVYEQQHAIKKDTKLGTYYITRQYFDEKMNGFEVKPGDILVSCAGTIGETYILPDEIEQGIINQALMRITLTDSIDKRFFVYYFDSNLKKSAQEESNGSAIKNIPPFDVMKNWYFPLTSKEEQIRIADKIDELLQYCQ